MNFGVVMLALMLAAASIFAVIAVASQNSTPYSDTYGNTTPASSNLTQLTVGNVTPAAMSMAGGAVVLLAVLCVAVAAIYVASVFSKGNGHGAGRR